MLPISSLSAQIPKSLSYLKIRNLCTSTYHNPSSSPHNFEKKYYHVDIILQDAPMLTRRSLWLEILTIKDSLKPSAIKTLRSKQSFLCVSHHPLTLPPWQNPQQFGAALNWWPVFHVTSKLWWQVWCSIIPPTLCSKHYLIRMCTLLSITYRQTINQPNSSEHEIYRVGYNKDVEVLAANIFSIFYRKEDVVSPSGSLRRKSSTKRPSISSMTSGKPKSTLITVYTSIYISDR